MLYKYIHSLLKNLFHRAYNLNGQDRKENREKTQLHRKQLTQGHTTADQRPCVDTMEPLLTVLLKVPIFLKL